MWHKMDVYGVITNFLEKHKKRSCQADHIVYDVRYSYKNELPKMPHLELPWSCGHAAHGYFRRGNFGGSVFCRVFWLNNTSHGKNVRRSQ